MISFDKRSPRVRQRHRSDFLAEPLEGRTLLSGTGLSIRNAPAHGGNILFIDGTAGDDQITVTQRGATLTVRDGAGWSGSYSASFKAIYVYGGDGNDNIVIDRSVKVDAWLFGQGGNDTLAGGLGNDHLFGGVGRNRLYAGSGDDTLISLGGSGRDRLYAGAGNDTFWLDNATMERVFGLTAAQRAAGAVHQVSSFMSFPGRRGPVPVSIQLDGPDLPDPTVNSRDYTYARFSTSPLFAPAGPQADDISQGDVGDCYLMAALQATAKTDPQRIRQSIVDLGDGTYAVRFFNGAKPWYVRVDADLPVDSSGELAYAGTGADKSLWVALVEKAYTLYHSSLNTYASIDGGMEADAFSDIGAKATEDDGPWSTSSLMNEIQSKLRAGQVVTFGTDTYTDGGVVQDDHAYSVDAVLTDAAGRPTALRLHNPWGVDGVGNDGKDDGYITITAAQAAAVAWEITYAAV